MLRTEFARFKITAANEPNELFIVFFSQLSRLRFVIIMIKDCN